MERRRDQKVFTKGMSQRFDAGVMNTALACARAMRRVLFEGVRKAGIWVGGFFGGEKKCTSETGVTLFEKKFCPAPGRSSPVFLGYHGWGGKNEI